VKLYDAQECFLSESGAKPEVHVAFGSKPPSPALSLLGPGKRLLAYTPSLSLLSGAAAQGERSPKKDGGALLSQVRVFIECMLLFLFILFACAHLLVRNH
jgi:hypothetical protein